MIDLLDRLSGGLCQFGGEEKCGDHVGECEVRITKKSQGFEWLISTCNNKLSCPFYVPVIDLVDRPAGGWSE